LERGFSGSGSGREVAVAVVSADCGTLLMVAFLSLSLRGLSPPSVSEACDSLGDVGILVAVMLAGKAAKVVEAARSDEAAQSVSVDGREENCDSFIQNTIPM
ncbi:hypothetical protein KCU83_g206, partial [Aureobasidium melanogenum]